MELGVDPDGHVRRSAAELRAAFTARSAMEPAVRRVRDSIVMLRRTDEDGARRRFRDRAAAVDRLQQVLHAEVLPMLRRVGFEV